jgi:hypothetical protein
MMADNAVTIENARLHQARIEAPDQLKKELNRAKSKVLDHLFHELRTALRFPYLCGKPTMPISSDGPRTSVRGRSSHALTARSSKAIFVKGKSEKVLEYQVFYKSSGKD